MAMLATYPDRFRFLDDQHTEISRALAELRKASKDGDGRNARVLAMSVLRLLRDHNKSEEDVMAEYEFPEMDMHASYHDHLIHTLEHIISYFDAQDMSAYRDQIAAHVENKVAEEVLVDRKLMAYLAEQ